MNYPRCRLERIDDVRLPDLLSEGQTGGARDMRLPLWHEPARGGPNVFLRSALFAAIQGKTRQTITNRILGSQSGTMLRFTGTQLDQSDLDVWKQVIHLVRSHSLENACTFRANAFLRAIGRSNGKAQYRWLDEAMRRLVSCFVEIRSDSAEFTGSLLSGCVRDLQTGIYRLTVDPAILKLYGQSDWTGVDSEQRRRLIGKPLALWLHGYYSSQVDIQPIGVDSLRQLSGSTNRCPGDFKRRLKEAFADLTRTTGIRATIDGNSVRVSKQRPTNDSIALLFEASNHRLARKAKSVR